MGSSSVIDRVRAHFDQGLRKFEVPEWGDESGPLVIYTTPLTLKERRSIMKLAGGDEQDGLARTLIMKARDKDGQALFTLEDKKTLVEFADSEVITRIVLWIADGVDVSDVDIAEAEAVKN